MTFEEELKYRLSLRMEALRNTGVDEKGSEKQSLEDLLKRLEIKNDSGRNN